MAVAYARAFGKVNPFPLAFRKWAYSVSDFNKYGLYHDDVLAGDELIEKALARVPDEVRNGRSFRIIRATQLSLMHRILPKEEWTTFEDDQKNRYLWKHLHEIVKEQDEADEWNKKY